MKEDNLNKYYVPFDWAEKLRDLGFDQPCINWYSTTHSDVGLSLLGVVNPEVVDAMLRNPNISGVKAPLLTQAFDWFRENYNKDSFIVRCNSTKEYFFDISWRNKKGLLKDFQSKGFKTHPEAELACLDKLIEIVEEQI